MDNHFTLDLATRNIVSTQRKPAEITPISQHTFDELGILDANYHGSADLLLRQNSKSWFDMDVFALDRFLEVPLVPFCLHLFCDVWSLHRAGADGEPPIISDVLQLLRLSRTVSEKYSCTNYYHTILHGMDVAHSFSCLLMSAQMKGILQLDRLECLVSLLSALMHDIDHPGVTYDYFYDRDIENFFKSKNLASSQSPLEQEAHTCFSQRQLLSIKCKRYLHSLESHQASMAVSVLLGSGLISQQPEQLQRQLCRLMTDLVESTDMCLHRSICTETQRLVEMCEEEPPEQLEPTDKLLLLCAMLKCSDTSNPAKSWDYYFAWSRLITAEFFAQGDKERYIRGCLNVNKFVTHFCDRSLVNFELSQIGFIKFIRESFQQIDDILRCKLTRRIIIQLEMNLKRMLMIRDVKRIRTAVDAKNPAKLRVILMLREPRDASEQQQPPGQKLKCCLLLHNREESRSAVRAMRSTVFGDKIQHIF